MSSPYYQKLTGTSLPETDWHIAAARARGCAKADPYKGGRALPDSVVKVHQVMLQYPIADTSQCLHLFSQNIPKILCKN
ncbi:MAG TPA: hypothetical protein VKR42_01790 [Ktedonobacteraceae bacterium]|nr:hypothetical protein [Ktedonobacteraceae bacterium]